MGQRLRWSPGDMPVVAELDDAALVDLSVEFERARSVVDAGQQAVFAELARRRVAEAVPLTLARKNSSAYEESLAQARDRELKYCVDEFGAALRLAQRTARSRVEDAIAIHDRLPNVWRALADGIITNPKARAFADALDGLDPRVAGAVVDELLPLAGDFTPGQLKVAIKRTVIAVDPEGAQERHADAKTKRLVDAYPVEDGMAWLRAQLTADEMTSIMAILNAYARACPGDDPRSMDTRRTDAFVDLLVNGGSSLVRLPDDIDLNGIDLDRIDLDRLDLTGIVIPDDAEGQFGADSVDLAETSAAAAVYSAASDPARADHADPDLSDADPTGENPTDGDPPDAVLADVEATDPDPTDADPTDADPTDADPADAVPADVVPADTTRAGGDPAEADRPGFVAGAGACAGRPVVRVDLRVVVAAGTLLGLDDKPGYLAGYGAIPAPMARRLAADATWRRLLTDPDTGQLLDLGRQRYRPSTLLNDYLEARDWTCRWPGCRRAAKRTDKDHSTPFPTGHTCRDNLLCLCRHHHMLKTFGNWTVRLDPDGTYTVTSPTGHPYITRPPTPNGAITPTTSGKPIYLNELDDPNSAPPRPEPKPYVADPPF